MITLDDLLGPYAAEPWSPAELASGARLVQGWNDLVRAYEADGGVLVPNPATGTLIGGNGNGGARPKGSKVGAPGSRHQLLLALDLYDPRRDFMQWLLVMGTPAAVGIGLWFEHPQWTRSWVHGQIVPPGSGARFFLPYADMAKNPVTCAALAGQAAANVQVFDFPAAA